MPARGLCRRHSKGFRQNLRQTLNLLLQQSEVYQKGIKVFVLTFNYVFTVTEPFFSAKVT